MTIDQVTNLHQAQPFQPFTIHLADGRSFHVRHPEMLFRTQGGRTVVLNTEGDLVVIIDLLLVTHLTVGNGRPKGRRRQA